MSIDPQTTAIIFVVCLAAPRGFRLWIKALDELVSFVARIVCSSYCPAEAGTVAAEAEGQMIARNNTEQSRSTAKLDAALAS
jgi:hypothetical protein